MHKSFLPEGEARIRIDEATREAASCEGQCFAWFCSREEPVELGQPPPLLPLGVRRPRARRLVR